MAETGEDIFNKIDKIKKDLYIEENEILDFINNPKNGKENLNELGEYLTENKNYPPGLKESIESLTDEEFKNTIGDKIKKGEKLSNYEVSLIYLNGSIKGQKFGKINFDQGLKEMCNGNLRRYIRSKYEKPKIYELINEEKSNIEKKLNKKYLEYNKNGYGEINLKGRQDQIKKSGDDVLKEVDEEITKKINELNEIARKNGYDLTHKNIKKIKDEEKKKVAKKIQSKYEEICTNRISDSKSTEIIKKISSRIDEYENLMNKRINDLINTINIKEYIGKGTENLSELGEELRLKENNKYPIWIEESIKCTVNGNFQKIIKNKLEKGENLTKDEKILIYLYGSLNGQNFGKIDLNQGLEEICNGELLKYSILLFGVKPKNNEKKERDDEIKNIKDFIDIYHTGYIYKEDILNYINDKINGEKNLNNLGEYLKLYRNLEITSGEGSLIGGLRELFEFDYQFNERIREKTKNNEEIDKKDIKIIYLQAQYEGKDLGKIELNKNLSQMCNGNLLKYIREKYNKGNKGVLQSTSGNTKRKGNEGYNPDKGKPLVTNVEELGNNTAKLPEIDDKETIYTRLKKIDKWAQSKYLAEYHEEKINSNKRHRNKTDQREKEEYIKYDLLKFALKKYSEEVNKEQLKIIEEAGYTKSGFEEDMRQLQKFYEEMKNRFPNINEIISEYNEIAEYDKECKERIFGGEEQYNQIGKKYGEYAKQVKEKEKQFGIEAIEEKIGKYSKMADNDGERIGFSLSKLTDEESLRYLLYHLEITKITGEYGDEIEKFKEYKLKMNEKYDNEKIKKTMDELQTFIVIINTHPGNLYINREDFQKYTKLKKENPELEKHLTNVNTITEALSNPASDDFNYILPIIHDDAIKKKMEQEIIDNERNELKENLPLIYYIKNFEAGFRNGLVDATIGVGTSLGVLLLNLRGDRDRVMASTKIKREMDNKFKVRQSSRQQDPIYSPETGFNITQDNLIASVGSSIANMLVLVYGGNEMGNIAKASGLEITEKAAFKQGLFQMGFFSQVGRSFEEAIQSNLEGKDALLYSILSAGVQGGLELVNPNEILLGQGSGIGKELITQLIAGKGNLFGKFLLKQVGKEIVQENLQEAMQLAAQNLMNQAWGGDLNVDWSRKNFAQTAIITTLTTGITTGISAGKQRLQLESSQPEIMARITSDQGLYEEVMGLIDKSIDGKFTIPNVKVEQLKDLRATLEDIDAIKEQNNEDQNAAQENQEKENVEQNNVERLQELGIEIPEVRQEYFNKMKLDFEVLRGLKELGINISSELVEISQFEKFDIGKLKHFQELGVEITTFNINSIYRMNLEDSGIINYGKLQKIGIVIYDAEILNRTEFDFQKLSKLKEFGININENNVIKFNGTNFDFQKLSKLKEFGININENNVIKFNGTNFDFQKLGKLKEFGININENNVIEFNLTNFDFQKISKLKEFGININENNIYDLNSIETNDLTFIKEIFEEFGFVIKINKEDRNNLNLSEEDKIKLKNNREEFVEKGIVIDSINELGIISNIIGYNMQNKQAYIERKNKYLEKHRTLSDEKFNELFKDGKNKRKHGIQHIYQTDLGYCYAYSGFELLKKSNYFDILIKTSLKETDTGREITLPLGDINGHKIKIETGEIDSKYSFTDRETGEFKDNININSDSSLGFKILEIAFIKEFLINCPKYLQNEEIIKKAKIEYQNTGDIKITGELLNILEGGWTVEFFEHILGKNVTTTQQLEINNLWDIIDYCNLQNIQIALSSYLTEEGYAPRRPFYGKNGSLEGYIKGDHMYSIERYYINPENNEKIIILVDPHNTSEKIEITLDECKRLFRLIDIISIDINKMFTEDQENIETTPFINNGGSKVETKSNKPGNHVNAEYDIKGDIKGDIKKINENETGNPTNTAIEAQENENVEQNNVERNNETGKIRDIKEIISILIGRKIQTINEYDIEEWNQLNIENPNKLASICEYYGIEFFRIEDIKLFEDNIDKLLEIKRQIESLGMTGLNDKLTTHFTAGIESFEELIDLLGENLYDSQLNETYKIIRNNQEVIKLLNDEKIKVNNISELQKILNLDLNEIQGCISMKNECKSNNIILGENDVDAILLLDKIGIKKMSEYINIQKSTLGIFVLDLNNQKGINNINKYSKSLITLVNLLSSKGICNIPWDDVLVQMLSETTTEQLQNIFDIEGICKNIQDYNFDSFLYKLIIMHDEDIKNIPKIYNKIKDYCNIKIEDLDALAQIKEEDIDYNFLNLFKNKFSASELWYIFNRDIPLTENDYKILQKILDNGITINNSILKNFNKLTEQDIKNIKLLQGLGIDIQECLNIKTLTEQDIENLKMLQEMGVNLKEYLNIKTLTEQDIENLKMLQEMGVDVTDYLGIKSVIEQIKTLTEQDIENLKMLQEMGVNIKEYLNIKPREQAEKVKSITNKVKSVIEQIKTLTEQDIENLKMLQELGVDIQDFSNIKLLTEQDIENLKMLQELNINFRNERRQPKQIKDILQDEINILKGLTETEIEFLKNDNKNLYEGYNKSKDEINIDHELKRGKIIGKFKQYLVEKTTNGNGNIIISEIIGRIRPELVTLSSQEIFDILIGIHKIQAKSNAINYYIDFENGPYKTPKELLCAIKGISDPNTIVKITDDINVIHYGTGIKFFIGDPESFYTINGGKREYIGGYYTPSSKMKELEGTVTIVNGQFTKEIDRIFKGIGTDQDIKIREWKTVIHEEQHNFNDYFMPESKEHDKMATIKDEIIAHMREGIEFKKIENALTSSYLHNYFSGKKLEEATTLTKELIKYANDLVELSNDPQTGLTKDIIISVLSDTPFEGRKDLHTRIMEAVKHKKTGESFRRAGTAEKETVINNLKNCNSIEEIKYILNDPQYSHIGWGTDNKGGIEISHIIDDVINRRLSINSIPTELSDIVKKFIK